MQPKIPSPGQASHVSGHDSDTGTPPNTKSQPRAASAPAQPPKAATAESSSAQALGSVNTISDTDWIISPKSPEPVPQVSSVVYSICSDSRHIFSITGLPETNPDNCVPPKAHKSLEPILTKFN